MRLVGASGDREDGDRVADPASAKVPSIPVQSLALLVGIEKFMSECRALTNVVGNGVATLVVSRWQGELDVENLRRVMEKPPENSETNSA